MSTTLLLALPVYPPPKKTLLPAEVAEREERACDRFEVDQSGAQSSPLAPAGNNIAMPPESNAKANRHFTANALQWKVP